MILKQKHVYISHIKMMPLPTRAVMKRKMLQQNAVHDQQSVSH